MFVGALVYVFETDGPSATGLASVVLLVPIVTVAPLAAAVAHRRRPNRVRLASYATQAVMFGGAAAAAFASAPVAVVIGPCAIGVAAITFVRPACAVLVPAIVRTSGELTVANLWVGYCDSVSVLGGPLVATVLLALDGPALVLAACAALALTSFFVGLSHVGIDPPPTDDGSVARVGALRLASRSLRAMRERPGASEVLAVAGGQYVLIGSLDLVFVVLAGDALDLGKAGAGLLSSLFGVGALLSAVGATFLVRRSRLAPIMVVALGVVALATVVTAPRRGRRSPGPTAVWAANRAWTPRPSGIAATMPMSWRHAINTALPWTTRSRSGSTRCDPSNADSWAGIRRV